MHLKIVETSVLKYMNLILVIFLSAPGLAWQAYLKKTGIRLELLTDTDMLLMVEKGIRGGICHSIHKYLKVNNKYMKNYDKNIESSHLKYLDANNLYGWAMPQKLSVNSFEWVEELFEFDVHFIKNFDENSDKGYFLEVDVEYPKNLFNLNSDLSFLPERKKTEKCKKLCCAHNSLKTSIKSQINTKKSTQRNSI